jgi:hypothetical protein
MPFNPYFRTSSSRYEDSPPNGREISEFVYVFVSISELGHMDTHVFSALFVYHTEVPKANQYLSAQPAMYSKRIRVVTALTEEAGLPMSADNIMDLLSHMETCFKIWISSELKQATVIRVEGRPVGVPSLVIEDLFNGGMSLECKEVHNIPVVGWWITPASSLMTCVLLLIFPSISMIWV